VIAINSSQVQKRPVKFAATGKMRNIEQTPMMILVTLGGECFGAEYEGVGNADGRDGVLYYFKLEDMRKDRGERIVSLFRSGTDKIFIKDYDARIEAVRLNALRRAFDSGTFSFETPFIEHRYHELRLTANDFQPQKKASDETIRHFIKLSAYYLGFKHPQKNAPEALVDFDCAEDFDYLGVQPQDIGRNLRLLTEEGYLRRSSAATLTNPDRVSPTPKLIREVEGTIQADDSIHGPNIQHGQSVSRKIFLVHGHSEDVNRAVASFLRTLSLEVVILREQPNQGQTIIEKFEKNSDVGFAVVLLTPDDSGAPIRDATGAKKRARQNVILELGYFIAKLGREHVCPIYVDEVELPSDLLGVLWVRYDKNGEWRSQLAKEINAAGIKVMME